MGLMSPMKVKSLLVQHYSIYPEFDNIVAREKVCFISLFTQVATGVNNSDKETVTYFIGQPFHEYLRVPQVAALKSWLATQR